MDDQIIQKEDVFLPNGKFIAIELPLVYLSHKSSEYSFSTHPEDVTIDKVYRLIIITVN